MASRGDRKAIGVLSVCEGCAATTIQFNADNPLGKSVRWLAQRVKDLCREGHSLWGAELKPGEIAGLVADLKRLEQTGADGEGRSDVSVMTSLCLALLDDLLQVVGDPRRRELLERLEHAVRQLHYYYDRKLKRPADYETAARAAMTWWS